MIEDSIENVPEPATTGVTDTVNANKMLSPLNSNSEGMK